MLDYGFSLSNLFARACPNPQFCATLPNSFLYQELTVDPGLPHALFLFPSSMKIWYLSKTSRRTSKAPRWCGESGERMVERSCMIRFISHSLKSKKTGVLEGQPPRSRKTATKRPPQHRKKTHLKNTIEPFTTMFVLGPYVIVRLGNPGTVVPK